MINNPDLTSDHDQLRIRTVDAAVPPARPARYPLARNDREERPTMSTVPAIDVRPGDFICVDCTDQLGDIIPVVRVVTIGDRTTIYRQAPHWTQPESHTLPAERHVPLYD